MPAPETVTIVNTQTVLAPKADVIPPLSVGAVRPLDEETTALNGPRVFAMNDPLAPMASLKLPAKQLQVHRGSKSDQGASQDGWQSVAKEQPFSIQRMGYTSTDNALTFAEIWVLRADCGQLRSRVQSLR